MSSSSGTSQSPQIVAAPDKGENITGRIKVFSSNLKTYCDSFYVILVFEFTTALRLHVHFTYFIHGFWRFCRDPKALVLLAVRHCFDDDHSMSAAHADLELSLK